MLSALFNRGKSRRMTPTPSQSISGQAANGPIHAAGVHLSLATPVKDGALQQAIQEYVSKLSKDDRDAFQSAPDIMEHLQGMQRNSKSPISSSLTNRVERVLQCIQYFMGSLAIFIQHHPEISSLVVGGVHCILTVGSSSTRYLTELKLIYSYRAACLRVHWVLWVSYCNDGTHRDPPFLPHWV